MKILLIFAVCWTHVITPSICITDMKSKACVTITDTVDLHHAPSTPSKNITYDPSTTSLNLICKGRAFGNITWQSEGIFAGLMLSYIENNRGVMLNIGCADTNRCSKRKVTCSGTGLSTSSVHIVDVYIFPKCTAHAEESIWPHQVTESNMKSASPNEMPFFGIILGFSICFGLALLSCLLVFLQKQLETGNILRICGGLCISHSYDNGNDTESPRDRGGQLPIMKMVRRKKRNGNQQHRKMGTVHEL